MSALTGPERRAVLMALRTRMRDRESAGTFHELLRRAVEKLEVPEPIVLDPGLPARALAWVQSVVAEFPGEDQIPLVVGDRTLTICARDEPRFREAVADVVKRAERWRDDRV